MNLRDAEALANKLIPLHLSYPWSFRWNDAKRAYGRCCYGPKKIELSSHLTPYEDEAHVRDTILHEIAHALTQGDGHGRRWKAMARRLGATPSSRSPSSNKDKTTGPECAFVLIYGNEIIKRYYKRPQWSVFQKLPTMWLRNRKAETQGKLKIVSYAAWKLQVQTGREAVAARPHQPSADKMSSNDGVLYKEPAWVMVLLNGTEQRVIKRYTRKPNPSTFRNIKTTYLTGRKCETQGKLHLMPYANWKAYK